MAKPIRTLLVAWTFLAVFPARSPAQALELGGGVHVPLNGDDESVFGAAPTISLGYVAPLNPGKTWVFFEVGAMRDTGDDVSPDPTFDLAIPVTCRAFPVSVGVRTDLVHAQARRDVALYFGFGLQVLFTRYVDPDGVDHDAHALGLLAELRPQLRLTEAWSIWVGGRVSVNTNVDGPSGDIHYSGTALRVGFEFRPGPTVPKQGETT